MIQKALRGTAAFALLAMTAGIALAQVPPYAYRIPLSGIDALPAPTIPGGGDGPGEPGEGTPLSFALNGALPTEAMVGYAITPVGVTVAGGTGAKSYSTPGASWMSLGATQLTGTPGAGDVGSHSYELRVSAGSETKTEPGTITVHGQFLPWVDGPSTANEGESVSVAIVRVGGKAPISYGIVGTVPGMSFSGNALTGAPAPGNHSFTLWAQDSFLNQRFEEQRSLTVAASPYTLALSAGALNMRSEGIRTKSATSTVPNASYSLVGAPPYVTITPQGLLTVTAPVVTETTAIPAFRLRATNAQLETQFKEIEVPSIGVIRPTLAIAASGPIAGSIGQPITPVSFTIAGADAGAVPTFTVSPPQALGLTVTATGVSGTPTSAGTATVTLSYTHPVDNVQKSEAFEIAIAKTLAIVMPSTLAYTGSPNADIVAQAPSVTGNIGAVTWSVVNESDQPLSNPPYSINAATGVVTLRAAAAGEYRAYLRAVEAGQSTSNLSTPIAFSLSAPDASTTRPGHHLPGGGYQPSNAASNATMAINGFYDESDATWARMTGNTQGEWVYFFPSTPANCAVVKAEASVAGVKLDFSIYAATGGWTREEKTLSTGMSTLTFRTAIRNAQQVNLTRLVSVNATVTIYEFQVGVLQSDDSCKTAP